MRVLVITGWIHPDAEGGSFRVAYDIARGLASRGHTVTVLTRRLSADHPACQTIEGMDFRRYEVAGTSGFRLFWGTVRAVRKAAETLEADVLHLHHPFSAFGANMASALERIPRIMTFHMARAEEYRDEAIYRASLRRARGAPFPYPLGLGIRVWALRRIDLFNLRHCSRIVVLSEFMRETLGNMDPSLVERAVLIPGGVDTTRFNRGISREVARRILGLPEGLVFFTLRRLEPRMGLENLVRAFAIVRRSRDAHLLIGGRGSLERLLTMMIEKEGLADRVKLLGFVEESRLPLYYRAADCTVIPTRALEGFGMAVIESLACGTPVIGTPVGGMPEILRRVDPTLVAAGTSPDHLAETMLHIAERGAESFEERAISVIRENYDLESIVSAYERLLRDLYR